MRTTALLAIVAAIMATLASASLAFGDGGKLRFRDTTQGRVLSVWTAPTPLRPGPIEVLVVQEAGAVADAPQAPQGGGTAGDAGAAAASLGDVAIEAWSDGALVARADASAVGPAARLARLELPASTATDEWRIELRIAIDGETPIDLRTDVSVEPPVSPFAEHWLALTLPAIAILLFALRERERAKRAGRVPAHST